MIQAIVMGGSAGAIDALSHILPELPPDFSVPIALVLHIHPDRPSHLAEVLGQKCALTVKEAEDKEPLEAGTLYVAPPNYHVLIEKSRHFALSMDEPVHFSRPAIDVLFESAAEAYGKALLGVLLSGANEDGADGLARIKTAGGATLVQSPDTATSRAMPEAALRAGLRHRVVALSDLGAAIGRYGAHGVLQRGGRIEAE